MEPVIRAKNFKLDPAIEEHIGKRLQKLERHLEDLQSTEVLLSQQPTRQSANRMQYVAQFTVQARHQLVRSEVVNEELLTAIDQGLDRLGKQLERHKTRQGRGKKGGQSLGKAPSLMNISTDAPSVAEMAAPAEPSEDFHAANEGSAPGQEQGGEIVRTKRFTAKPLHPEEAVEQMELLGHNFFVFWNAEDERVSVVYRRNDGNYGLIEPEFS